MSFTEKMDVLDLLINIIKEHEAKLDELISRLENTEAIQKSGIDLGEYK